MRSFFAANELRARVRIVDWNNILAYMGKTGTAACIKTPIFLTRIIAVLEHQKTAIASAVVEQEMGCGRRHIAPTPNHTVRVCIFNFK